MWQKGWSFNMVRRYWWSRFGDYPPGEYNGPHMGRVVADYRVRVYNTQKDFAKVVGVDPRTIEEWEASVFISNIERRVLLARLLKIPPALLALDWHNVYQDG